MSRSRATAVETYSGEFLDFLAPAADSIKIEDIVRGLATSVRFAGQVSRFYSIAEHGVRVSLLVQEMTIPQSDPRPAFAGLHHDSHEAYIGDLTAPFKWAMDEHFPGFAGALDDLRWRIDVAIGLAFVSWEGLAQAMKDPGVKAADDEMLFREAATLKYSHGIGAHWGNTKRYTPLAGAGWTPDEAERAFMARHNELLGAINEQQTDSQGDVPDLSPGPRQTRRSVGPDPTR